MAKRYSDAIKIRETKSAYNIQTEEGNEWMNFIPNEQFNEILKKVISSVNNKVVDDHRSFWLEGAYGTGKSHAAAVIKHLLCDSLEDIEGYIKDEYSAEKYSILRESLYAVRKKTRLFPVAMYGSCSISNKDDLSLQIQLHVMNALEEAGIDISVKTDFDNYIANIENNPLTWDDIINRDAELQSYAPDRAKLIKELKDKDASSSILSLAKKALRNNSGFHVVLEQEDLCKWFFEVQDELAQKTEYNGILLLWDEFTDVMDSEIGPSLLTGLQALTERTQQTTNNSYLFHIAHPSALDRLKADERTKTTGRYHYMQYNMEPVSAFKIMSRKFVHEQDNSNPAYTVYHEMTDMYFAQMHDVYEKYASTSNNPMETLNDLKSLFPVHPATANLATYFAREVGSSSRSVFEFLGSNPAIRVFLDDEERFAKGDMITSDFLWDYVQDEFNKKTVKYGVVTERFNSYKILVGDQSKEHLAVFKSILLLNAFNNLAANETVTPSEENIRNMYVGTPIDENIDEILAWFDKEGVVQRSPQGIYEIRFSALDTKELEEFKKDLLEKDYKHTSDILKFGDTASKEFEKKLKAVNRPLSFGFFSEDNNEHVLLNSIEKARNDSESYEIYLALMMAKSNAELINLKEIASKAMLDERFNNVAFFVFDSIIDSFEYERFVEYQARAKCSTKHGFAEQATSHTNNAKEIISDWLKSIFSGTCTVYLQGENTTISARTLPAVINSSISPKMFSKGPESLEILRTKAPQTCWVKQFSNKTADTILSFNTKDDIISRCIGPAKHIQLLLQDSVDDNLKFKDGIDVNHPLYLVYRFVKSKIDHTDKQNTFNFADKFKELTMPPYGLFKSHAGYGMLAFALRPYVDKVFDTTGKPINSQRMQELIDETFKIWDSGSKNIHKVDVKFETREEGSIAKGLIHYFQLGNLKDYKDVTSLTDARWALRNGFCPQAGYPLWAIKYCDKLQNANYKDKALKLIDNIITIYTEVGVKNPALMVETDSFIRELWFDFPSLLNINAENNFANGFLNFLISAENVNLQEEEYDAALDYIKQHMEGGVGLWTENNVVDQLKNWRISLIPPKPSVPQDFPEDPIVVDEPPIDFSKKNKARERIQSISSVDEAKQILNALCDLGYDNILDTILK